jgi:hypothetical protein
MTFSIFQYLCNNSVACHSVPDNTNHANALYSVTCQGAPLASFPETCFYSWNKVRRNSIANYAIDKFVVQRIFGGFNVSIIHLASLHSVPLDYLPNDTTILPCTSSLLFMQVVEICTPRYCFTKIDLQK